MVVSNIKDKVSGTIAFRQGQDGCLVNIVGVDIDVLPPRIFLVFIITIPPFFVIVSSIIILVAWHDDEDDSTLFPCKVWNWFGIATVLWVGGIFGGE